MKLARFQRLLLMMLLGALMMSGFAIPSTPVSAALLEPDTHSASNPDSNLRPVQVFDVAASKVVSTIPNDMEFQKMAASWTESITGLAPQVSADQSCSYVYRVPLAKPAAIVSGEINVSTSDLFLFYCKDEAPMLLVFDEQRKPYLFLFKADIGPFIKKVGLPAL